MIYIHLNFEYYNNSLVSKRFYKQPYSIKRIKMQYFCLGMNGPVLF